MHLPCRPIRTGLLTLIALSACTSVTPPGNTPSSTPPAASSSTGGPLEPGQQELVFQALAQLGTPYKSGGNNPVTGFDCSGLVVYVFRLAMGMTLPRSAEEIGQRGMAIPAEQLQPGDLVFYNTQGRPNSHVGIYLGDDRFIHAPSERGVVRIENMALPYWVKRYDGARRIG